MMMMLFCKFDGDNLRKDRTDLYYWLSRRPSTFTFFHFAADV